MRMSSIISIVRAALVLALLIVWSVDRLFALSPPSSLLLIFPTPHLHRFQHPPLSPLSLHLHKLAKDSELRRFKALEGLDPHEAERQRVLDVFVEFDQDGSGAIDANELGGVSCSHCLEIGDVVIGICH